VRPDGSLAHQQRYYKLHVPDNADDSGADSIAWSICLAHHSHGPAMVNSTAPIS
jgi:hypothetical protein